MCVSVCARAQLITIVNTINLNFKKFQTKNLSIGHTDYLFYKFWLKCVGNNIKELK